MSVVAFALVVRSKTSSDDAAARTARALWAAVASQRVHVHDFDRLVTGIWGCKTCDETVRAVPQ